MTASGPDRAGRRDSARRSEDAPDRPRGHLSRIPEAAWRLLALAPLALLPWVTRRAPAGTPVADDYDFLFWLRFHRPVGLFDAMGGGPYWRPLSRQLYYAVLAPVMFRAPWVVAGAHLVLLALLANALWRIARRAMSAPLAAAVASFPLLSRPVRTLYVWPSGGEPLLALVGVALALDAALSRRRGLACVAVLATALSYEQGLLVVPLLGIVLLVRREPLRPWLAPMLACSAAWAVGTLLAARAHAGVLGGAWFAAGAASRSATILPDAWAQVRDGFASQLGLGDVRDATFVPLAFAYAAAGAVTLALFARRPARGRVSRELPLVAGGAAWFVVSMAVAALGSPGWYPWRTMLPGLGLGVAVVALLAAADPGLVAAVVAVRLVALLAARPVPPGVEGPLPRANSRHAFVRVARLQRVVDSARRTLLARHPSLPRGAAVRYWALPEMTAWGFDGAKAVRVWYGDSTLTWDWLAYPAAPHDVVLAFDPDSANPAVEIAPASLAAFAAARAEMAAGAPRPADSLYAEAAAAQPAGADAYRCALATEAARAAHALGDDERAQSLNDVAWRLGGETPAFLDMAATLALAHGRPDVAAAAARRCLELSPADSEAHALLHEAPRPVRHLRAARPPHAHAPPRVG